MNKSAVLSFAFLSKRFGPGPSSVELQVLVTPLMKGRPEAFGEELKPQHGTSVH